MELSIQPFTAEWTDAVKSFNQRLVAGGLESGLVFPESPTPEFPRRDSGKLYQEHFIVVDGSQVRGGFILTHEQWSVFGQVHSAAHFRLPISEGIINRNFRAVWPEMYQYVLRVQPRVYSVGMGGIDKPHPRRLKAGGWDLCAVPFYFYIRHPQRFLRQIEHLRGNWTGRLILDLAAWTGTGWLGIKALHSLKGLRSPAVDSVKVEPVSHFSDWADQLWERCKTSYRLISTRDSETLNLRYSKENSRFIKLKVDGPKGVLGWAVLLDTQMQGNKYFGDLRVGTLADCLALPDDANMVVRSATEYLTQRGVDLIVSNQTHGAWCKALGRAGFVSGRSNFLFAASPELSKLVHPFHTNQPQFFVNRADGPGPTRL